MAKSGIVIYILVITLLLDQTSSHTSKFKARKHSKRRVKEKDGDLKTQVEKLWREVNALKEMQALQSVCLRGTKFNKKCYLASESSKHFHDANEDCISKGGTLVIPRSSDEINALRDYGKRSLPGVNDFWLGINDMVTEGKFVDVNGITISFLNWDNAQPNGGKRENCALLSQSAQGKWSDEVCGSSKRYICEFTIP
ncbi:C-type lectin domain family 3 member A [Diceros bicornis minor]|uniref:C-type lectin domain family 3 member A n=1 Tax=Ceratotherium simum simum TaxID=73337 RepID=A0ABM0HZE1_CERSS|nr:PREDICTED: C-type lectin domain family 3 member A [Ceratotherium simum simum]XP_058384314.1 C-type lectin domain family 3 member A [Diceros bicornis minor]